MNKNLDFVSVFIHQYLHQYLQRTSWLRERDFERDAQRVCWNSKSIWWVSWPRRNAASYQPRNLNSSQVFDNFLLNNCQLQKQNLHDKSSEACAYQYKVTSSLAAIHRLGHGRNNCNAVMAYYIHYLHQLTLVRLHAVILNWAKMAWNDGTMAKIVL